MHARCNIWSKYEELLNVEKLFRKYRFYWCVSFVFCSISLHEILIFYSVLIVRMFWIYSLTHIYFCEWSYENRKNVWHSNKRFFFKFDFKVIGVLTAGVLKMDANVFPLCTNDLNHYFFHLNFPFSYFL